MRISKCWDKSSLTHTSKYVITYFRVIGKNVHQHFTMIPSQDFQRGRDVNKNCSYAFTSRLLRQYAFSLVFINWIKTILSYINKIQYFSSRGA